MENKIENNSVNNVNSTQTDCDDVLDDYIADLKQTAGKWEHAMCDGDDTQQERKCAQEKWEYYSQLVMLLEELKELRAYKKQHTNYNVEKVVRELRFLHSEGKDSYVWNSLLDIVIEIVEKG